MFVQGTQRIEVIVRKEGGLATQGAKEKDVLQSGEQEEKSTASATRSNKNSGNRAMTFEYTKSVFNIGRQVFSYTLNTVVRNVGRERGDQAAQQIVSRQVEIGTDWFNGAVAVASGIAFGAQFGPVGMIVGGALGAVGSILSVVHRDNEREREFNLKAFKENNSISYARARASISLTTGRLR